MNTECGIDIHTQIGVDKIKSTTAAISYDINDSSLKNLMHDMFAQESSQNIKRALKERMEKGSSIASKPPYGYKFDTIYDGEEKRITLIPEGGETTETVKDIYMLYIKGWGAGKIATYLNEKGVPTPSSRLKNHARSKFGLWTNNTIFSILQNHKYGGYLVQQKYEKVSYDTKEVVRTSEDKWIWSGEFEGIIDKDTFNQVQMLLQKRSTGHRYKGEVIHPFSTVLKCGTCGGSLGYRKKYEGYKCTLSQSGGKRCTCHSAKEKDLISQIQEELKSMESTQQFSLIKEKFKEELNNLFNNNMIERYFVETIIDNIVIHEVLGSKKNKIEISYNFNKLRDM